MITLVRSSVGGKPCSIDKRALILEASSSVLQVIFGRNSMFKYNEYHDMYTPYVDMFQDICDFLSTGHMSDTLRTTSVDYIADMIDIFNIGFTVHTRDYLMNDVCDMLENQWYRSRRYHELYVDSWEQSFVYEVSEQDYTNIYNKYLDTVFEQKSSSYLSKHCSSNRIRDLKKTYGDMYHNVLLKETIEEFDNKARPVQGPGSIKANFTRSILSNMFEELREDAVYGGGDPKGSLSRLAKSMGDNIASKVPELGHLISDIKGDDTEAGGVLMLQKLYAVVSEWLFDGQMVIAGGSVCDYVSGISKFKDIDIFFIGCTQKYAEEKITKISLLSRSGRSQLYCRTSSSITFKNAYRVNNSRSYHESVDVQFILRLYKDMEEVLMGFDLDASAIGTDGYDIYMTRACKNSLYNRICTVNFDRLSMNYESRLCKYARVKGFGIYVPNLHQVSVRDYYTTSKHTRGLQIILMWYITGRVFRSYGDYDSDSKRSFDGVKQTVEYNGGDIKQAIASTKSKWKAVKPGEQTTGSFHSRVLDDVSIWYEYSDDKGQNDSMSMDSTVYGLSLSITREARYMHVSNVEAAERRMGHRERRAAATHNDSDSSSDSDGSSDSDNEHDGSSDSDSDHDGSSDDEDRPVSPRP